MGDYAVNILGIEEISPNIFKIILEKPGGYTFTPGQYANISLLETSLGDKKGSFCFTGLVNLNYLEFIIKLYNNNNSLKKRIVSYNVGDKIKISEPQGTFRYKGMGVFIAAGTGITPVIAILRDLKLKNDLAGNMLIYSNRSMDDVILNTELTNMLGTDYINVFTKRKYNGCFFGRIDKNFLRMEIVDFIRYFYICGSMEFVQDIRSILRGFDVVPDSIIYENAFNSLSVR